MPRQEPRTYRVLALILRPLLRVLTRRSWYGGEHLPRSGGFIVVANHMTNLDPLVVAHFLDGHGAAPRFLAKSELFGNRVVAALLGHAGQIPVHRGTANARDALAAADAALTAGGCVVIFPEGTFTRDPDLWPMTGRTGAARLALRTGVPVIPVAQWGAHRILPRYSNWLRIVPRRPVTVVAGPPVDLSGLDGTEPDHATLGEATARITAAITRQLAHIRAEEPPERPYDMRRDGDPRAGHNAAGPPGASRGRAVGVRAARRGRTLGGSRTAKERS
ncbi:MAG: lysophospholipid acyltransferase family protein [Georgenia sp.]